MARLRTIIRTVGSILVSAGIDIRRDLSAFRKVCASGETLALAVWNCGSEERETWAAESLRTLILAGASLLGWRSN